MSKIAKYFKIISIYSKNSIKYRSNLIVGFVSMLTRCAVTLLLYSYAYKVSGGSINGSTFIESSWSMFFYFIFMILAIRRIFSFFEYDILSGGIEMYITKPLNYLKYNVLKKIGEDILIFIIVLIIGSALMVLLVGIPSTFNTFTFLSIFVTSALGIILSLVFYSIIGLLAFYIQKVRSLYNIIDKFVMVLGGSYLPIALFPKIMKDIATYSPFGAINFVTSTVYSSWQNEFIIKILMQIVWIILLYFLLIWLFEKAKRKLAINGG